MTPPGGGTGAHDPPGVSPTEAPGEATSDEMLQALDCKRGNVYGKTMGNYDYDDDDEEEEEDGA